MFIEPSCLKDCFLDIIYLTILIHPNFYSWLTLVVLFLECCWVTLYSKWCMSHRSPLICKVGSDRKALHVPHNEIRLFLFLIGSTMGIKHLHFIFGTTPSACSSVIQKFLKIMPWCLDNHPFAKVELAALIHSHNPVAHDVIDFMDSSLGKVSTTLIH